MADLPTEPPLTPSPGSTNSQGLPIGPVAPKPPGSTNESGLPVAEVPGLTAPESVLDTALGTVTSTVGSAPISKNSSKTYSPGIVREPDRVIDTIFQEYQIIRSTEKTAGSGDPVLSARSAPLPMIFSLNIPNAPPALTLFVNPSTWSINHARSVTEGLTRAGWLIEHHGENLDTIQAEGTTAGFYTSTTGLTRLSRKDSAAYRNLIDLVSMYKNNGVVFDSIDTRRIVTIGDVEIYYDGVVYVGSFDSFSITEDSRAPFLLRYNFTFIVRYTSDNPAVVQGHRAKTVAVGEFVKDLPLPNIGFSVPSGGSVADTVKKQIEASKISKFFPTSLGDRIPAEVGNLVQELTSPTLLDTIVGTLTGGLSGHISSDGLTIAGGLSGGFFGDMLSGITGSLGLTFSGTISGSGSNFSIGLSGNARSDIATELLGETAGTIFNEVLGMPSISGGLSYNTGSQGSISGVNVGGALGGSIPARIQSVISRDASGICGAVLSGPTASILSGQATSSITASLTGTLVGVGTAVISAASTGTLTGERALQLVVSSVGTVTPFVNEVVNGQIIDLGARVSVSTSGIYIGTANLISSIPISLSITGQGVTGSIAGVITQTVKVPITGSMVAKSEGRLKSLEELDKDPSFVANATPAVLKAVTRAKERKGLL